MAEDYFAYGPVDEARYNKSRGGLDGLLGFFDGVSGVANSAARTVGSITDISEDITAARRARNDERLDREAREQALLRDMAGFQRGDNVKLYWVIGAAAVAMVVLTSR